MQNHEHLEAPSDKNDESFILYNWHVDFPPEDVPKLLCSYISIHMKVFNCESDVGQTLFINLVDLYKRCPEKYKKELNKNDVQFIGLRGSMPGETVNNRTFRALRTHPVTKETILFWTCGFWSGFENEINDLKFTPAVKLNGENKDWFNSFSNWVLSELRNKDNWGIWSWSKDDFIIWDNRALLHSFTGGWKKEDRIFWRSNIASEEVF